MLSIKPFRRLWIALSLSSLGDWLSILALLWLAPSVTNGSNLAKTAATGKPMVIKDGRFGPYVTDGETNASLRKGDEVATITPERGAELLADRRAAAPAPRARKATTTKTAATAKKTTATAAKKTTGTARKAPSAAAKPAAAKKAPRARKSTET